MQVVIFHAPAIVQAYGQSAKARERVPKLSIFLCSYFGERFLAEQLCSIEAQSFSDWKVWVSDDGSTDDTEILLKRLQIYWGIDRLERLRGPGKGFVANFLSLVCREEINSPYYAFADQDDIWDSDHLARAVDWLESVPAGLPALYCSRTRLIREDGVVIGLSPLFCRQPAFANALVQNIASGNTMVFNEAARRLLQIGGGDIDVAAHDWWTYLVVTACGGLVRYDPLPSVSYRQHGGNQIGARSFFMLLPSRVSGFLEQRFRGWMDCNLLALKRLDGELDPSAERVLERLVEARQGGLYVRVCKVRKAGLYRQNWIGDIFLLMAAIFGRI
jgi:glycosyltransferase involved in cell wall biosynthesis